MSGTFNLLHAGHVRLLEFASRYGRVVVGLNTDPYLWEKYGDRAVPLTQRAYVVGACRYVGEVVSFDGPDPSDLIRQLRPQYYVRGPDYTGVLLPEQAALDQVGCRVVIHEVPKEQSSSLLLWGLEGIVHPEKPVERLP